MIKPYIYGFIALAIITLAIAAYTKGRTDNQTKNDLDNAKNYIEGTQDAQDAKTDLPDTDTGIVEWLLRPWD